jgi:gliding motility-associated-like protein
MRLLDNEIMKIRFTNSNLFTKIIVTAYSLLVSFISFSQTEYEAPKLSCVSNNASNIELTWQLPLTANPCFTGYEIYASVGSKNGPYTLNTTIANAAQTTTLLTISSGGLPVFFYLINRGSCNNPVPLTSITSDTLDNVKPQPFVVLQNATVINGQVQLNWLPAPSTEVSAYLVYNDRDGFTTPDTVAGRLNTTYLDVVNDPDLFAIRYKVRALEFCEDPAGLQGAITPDSADHRTVLMQVGAPDKCTQTSNISWQSYKIGGAQVVSYEVQQSVNRGAYTIAGVQPGTSNSFLLQNIPFRDTVCVRVKANLPNGTSAFSNERCISADVIQKPVNDYIRNITVENGSIFIDYQKDMAAAPARTVILQRSNDGIVFTPIINTPTEPTINTYLFEDPNLPVGSQTFTYRVNLLDSCFNTHTSDTATTLRVGIKVKSNNRADIIWSGFDISNISFDNFRLEKIIGSDTTFVGNFNRSETTFLETALFDYGADSLSAVCYRVTAFFENNNDVAPRETLASHSNIVCVQPEPKAFVPQAFVPTGHNKTFKPFLLYAKPDNYDFKIFDRWYHLIFSTNDINGSWDGNYNGAPAPLDGYIYVIKYKGKDDNDYTQTGTIMLLK